MFCKKKKKKKKERNPAHSNEMTMPLSAESCSSAQFQPRTQSLRAFCPAGECPERFCDNEIK